MIVLVNIRKKAAEVSASEYYTPGEGIQQPAVAVHWLLCKSCRQRSTPAA